VLSLTATNEQDQVHKLTVLSTRAGMCGVITCIAGRMVAAVVCIAPDTMPSASPQCTIITPNMLMSFCDGAKQGGNQRHHRIPAPPGPCTWR
jgi:hypothetical protein